MIKSAGSFSICQNHAGKILLVKRKDYPIWDLPGGKIESGESPKESAIRETFEETGFQIGNLSLVGTYFNPELEDRQYIFKAEILKGSLNFTGDETAQLDFFSPDKLPLLMVPHRKLQIRRTLQSESAENFEIHDSFFVRWIKKH